MEKEMSMRINHIRVIKTKIILNKRKRKLLQAEINRLDIKLITLLNMLKVAKIRDKC